MSWAGEPGFGDGWAVFQGHAAENALHVHAAIQLSVAAHGALTMRDGAGVSFTAPALLVRPLVEHALDAQGAVTLIYVEPQSPLAVRLLDLTGPQDIGTIDVAGALDLAPHAPVAAWISRFAEACRLEAPVDPRLVAALALLSREPGRVSIGAAARDSGLSESRLRTVAREVLGLPLSTWLIWRKLERAARALSEGEAIAGAAVAGGFADQAHLTRAMRRMFGVTPRTAQRAVAGEGSR